MKAARFWSASFFSLALTVSCAPVDDEVDEPAPSIAALQVSCSAAQGQRVITVAKDGSGQFKSVQAAVNAIASGNATPVLIHIKPGTYKEQLTIAGRSKLTLCGDDAKKTVLTFDTNSSKAGSLDNGASVRVSADDFSAANITFENSSPLGSAQAVALVASGKRQQFVNCRFLSYQDTLYTKAGTQYFRDSYIQGNVDFVFGGATAVLQNCELRTVSKGSAIAAPRTDASLPFGLVFLGGKVTAASGIAAKSVALARPWGPSGAAAYLNVELGGHISAAGWTEMSGNSPSNARFSEYKSTGPGASPSTRVRGTRQLSDADAKKYTPANVLGWSPSYAR
ncbi:MAG: pectinesterase family protein [Polyangiales bacterium]